jgi:hypothetical protein
MYLEDHHCRHRTVGMPNDRSDGDGIDAGFLASFASSCFPDAVFTSLIGPLIDTNSPGMN